MPYLILLDKPQGITSFRAVSEIRHILGEKRIGHTGTLDPMATGVLPLLTGRASRLSSLMLDSDKRYTAGVRLGITTDSLDITGNVLSQNKVNVTDRQLQDAVEHFHGVYMQKPPMFSALKKDGVRLYQLARRGEEIERESREVNIKEITLLQRENETDFTIDVLCSKGTYIRSLADDIGAFLGTGAVMTSLRRTFTAGFSVEDCTKLDDIKNGTADNWKLSPERCVMHLKSVDLSEKQAERFKHGGELDFARLHGVDALTNGELLRVRHGGEFIGIGRADVSAECVRVHCVIT